MKNDGLGRLTTLQVKPIDNKSLEPEDDDIDIEDMSMMYKGLGKMKHKMMMEK